MYGLFILFFTNFLHLEQSIKLKAGNSHGFRKCSNYFLEELSEDEGIFSLLLGITKNFKGLRESHPKSEYRVFTASLFSKNNYVNSAFAINAM